MGGEFGHGLIKLDRRACLAIPDPKESSGVERSFDNSFARSSMTGLGAQGGEVHGCEGNMLKASSADMTTPQSVATIV